MVPLQLLSLCPINRWTGLLALYSHIRNVNKKPIDVLGYPLERSLLFIDKYFEIDKCQAPQLYCSCAWVIQLLNIWWNPEHGGFVRKSPYIVTLWLLWCYYHHFSVVRSILLKEIEFQLQEFKYFSFFIWTSFRHYLTFKYLPTPPLSFCKSPKSHLDCCPCESDPSKQWMNQWMDE